MRTVGGGGKHLIGLFGGFSETLPLPLGKRYVVIIYLTEPRLGVWASCSNNYYAHSWTWGLTQDEGLKTSISVNLIFSCSPYSVILSIVVSFVHLFFMKNS